MNNWWWFLVSFENRFTCSSWPLDEKIYCYCCFVSSNRYRSNRLEKWNAHENARVIVSKWLLSHTIYFDKRETYRTISISFEWINDIQVFCEWSHENRVKHVLHRKWQHLNCVHHIWNCSLGQHKTNRTKKKTNYNKYIEQNTIEWNVISLYKN